MKKILMAICILCLVGCKPIKMEQPKQALPPEFTLNNYVYKCYRYEIRLSGNTWEYSNQVTDTNGRLAWTDDDGKIHIDTGYYDVTDYGAIDSEPNNHICIQVLK